MISQTSEFALRAVVFLASQPGRSRPIPDILEGTRVPRDDLDRILANLAHAGLVTSPREGIFALVSPPQEVTVYAVVQAVAPVSRITECPLGFADHGVNLCPLHRALDNAMLAVETAFRKLTVHHLLNQPQTSRPLCQFPRMEPGPAT